MTSLSRRRALDDNEVGRNGSVTSVNTRVWLAGEMAKQKCKMLDLHNTKKVLESVDVILCDCDGVLWTSDRVIAGVPDAIDKLKAMGKKIFYVTNNSNKSRKEYVKKFLGMGYHVVDDDIFAASYVTAEHLKTEHNYQGKVAAGIIWI